MVAACRSRGHHDAVEGRTLATNVDREESREASPQRQAISPIPLYVRVRAPDATILELTLQTRTMWAPFPSVHPGAEGLRVEVIAPLSPSQP